MASDGSSYERELRDLFSEEWGGAGMRCPSSGSGTKLELPDVLGSANGQTFAIENKYVGKGNKYARYKVDEAKKLIYFAYLWEAVPVLTARFSHDTNFYAWVIMTEDQIPQEYDSFAIKKEDRESYPKMNELVKNPPLETATQLNEGPPEV